MSRLLFQGWRIHNPTRSHAEYLGDLALTWKTFQAIADVENMTIEQQRETFEQWVMCRQMEYAQNFIHH